MDKLDEFCGSKFWDLNVTWNTEDPDFTKCFEQTVFVWVPCAFLWLVAGFEIVYAMNSKNHNRIPNTVLNLLQRSIVLVLIILQILHFAYSYRTSHDENFTVNTVDRVAPAVKAVTFCLAIFLQTMNQRKGIHSSGSLFTFWFLSTIFGVFEFQTELRNLPVEDNEHRKFWFIILMIAYPLTVIEFLLSFFSDNVYVPILNVENVSHKEEEDRTGKPITDNNPCPEMMASFPSVITYQWFWKLAWLGYKKPLEFSDLWDLNPTDRSRPVIKLFYKYWKPNLLKNQKMNSANKALTSQNKKLYTKEESDNNNGDSKVAASDKKSEKSTEKKNIASIMPALVKANWDVFLFGASLKLVQDLLSFVSPQILDLLIQHVSSDDESWKGYLYAATMFITSMAQTLLLGQYFHRMFMVGMRVRSSVVGAIYQKSLVISNSARKEFTLGEIVNLMSVDCQRFMDLTTYLNMIWSAPLQICLSVYFLWNVLGVAVLAGLAVLILLIPVNTFLATQMKKLQIQQMKNKDERVKLMNEILSGIKVLKLYAWEPSFQDQINEIRQRELSVLRKAKILVCVNTLVWTLAPFLVSLSSFATYVLMDKNHILDARKAFVALTLFNIMRMPMSILPMIIVYLVEAGVSLKRVNRYMNADEIEEDAVTHDKPSDDSVVTVSNGSFTWGESDTLKNINLQVKKGSLVAIVGSVGSGKSSLLSAILGEMEKQNGKVNTIGSIAYIQQIPWIQNLSLKDNILFGKDYDASLYKQAVDVCALRPDLQILPAGDQTEIGEKGINLSGGQKQRVSLARATYCDADVYLLDDPLSAVDSHVGKHLFEKMIGPQGVLKNKTRIIVTHGITYLPHMDHIIVMNNGQISETGTFSQLLEKKGAFADFLVQHATAEDLEHADKSTVEKLEAAIGDKVDVFAKQISRVSESDAGGNNDRRGSLVSISSRRSEKSAKEAEENYLSRRASRAVRMESTISTKEPEKDKLIEAERTEVGSVKRDVYTHYMKSVGWGLAISVLVFQVAYSGLSVYTNMWLAKWSNEPAVNGAQDTQKRDVYLGVYGALGLGQGLAVFAANFAMTLGSLQAARYLHNNMLTHILHSPMSFFDTTPLGRIVNRFAKDVDVADSTFPENLRSWISCLFSVLSTILVISYSTPWFLVVILPTGIVYYGVQRFYVASSRQMKRLESVSRSPIYSHFSETLTGSMTIRAYSKQAQFIQESENHVDHNQIAYYPSIIANRWLAVRLETVGNLIIFFAALFAVLSDPDEGSVGLSVSYALSVTQILNWLVRMTSDVETNIVAVERIKEYGETPQEAAWEIPDKKPSPEWPQSGNITFEGYQSRYREGLDLVLKNVTCDIKSGEKVGIVGRTGAGKSSLTLGLFRIVEAAGGSIKIDGVDLSTMGLHDVRGKLTIIPQDPVLFSGNLRLNLDPFKRYSDSDIWHALEYAHLKQFVNTLPAGLEHAISEGGENLSVGQRQLVCLARALLRKTKILVLDEATAAVDLETDDLIQQTIRSEFKECTVLTIAHRLNTIMDCNRVMVLDDGKIREFASPQDLLGDPATIFYSMAKDAGLV